MMKKLFIIAICILILPQYLLADLENDLKKNLDKSKCLESWNYTNNSFTISMKESRCDEGEPTAILLTIRYLYESNNEKFPKYIVVKYSHGITEKYPFTNIPSMIE